MGSQCQYRENTYVCVLRRKDGLNLKMEKLSRCSECTYLGTNMNQRRTNRKRNEGNHNTRKESNRRTKLCTVFKNDPKEKGKNNSTMVFLKA